MTYVQAAALRRRRQIADAGLVIWYVTLTDAAHPGCAVAYAMKGSIGAERRLSGELVASTVRELRAMLPRRLVQSARGPFDPVGTIETWG